MVELSRSMKRTLGLCTQATHLYDCIELWQSSCACKFVFPLNVNVHAWLKASDYGNGLLCDLLLLSNDISKLTWVKFKYHANVHISPIWMWSFLISIWFSHSSQNINIRIIFIPYQLILLHILVLACYKKWMGSLIIDSIKYWKMGMYY